MPNSYFQIKIFMIFYAFIIISISMPNPYFQIKNLCNVMPKWLPHRGKIGDYAPISILAVCATEINSVLT